MEVWLREKDLHLRLELMRLPYDLRYHRATSNLPQSRNRVKKKSKSWTHAFIHAGFWSSGRCVNTILFC